ncbi:MAG: S8 family serine peptidase [Bacteroidota bacterium]
MKRPLCLWLGLCVLVHLLPAQNAYYYSVDGPTELLPNYELTFVELTENATRDDLEKSLLGMAEITRFATDQLYRTLNVIDREGEDQEWSWAEVRLLRPGDREAYASFLQQLGREGFVETVAPYFTVDDSPVGVSNYFYVKLQRASDFDLLQDYAEKQDARIAGQNTFMPLWYVLRVTKQSGLHGLEMANRFYESGLFAEAHPDFLIDLLDQCASDPLFPTQWNLRNTGQNGGTSGADIRVCSALNAGSSSVRVAVLDQGIQLNHPDLQQNIHSSSYDCQTGTSPSQLRGTHGTNCAGIVSARKNNGQGVSSVAPYGRMMSVSHSLTFVTGLTSHLSDGLNWSWQNGADVISNSWGHSTLGVSIIQNAIQNALNSGRGGKGTVVCFAAGNSNSSVLPPANTISDIIAVGAMSPCYERKNPSSCDGEFWWGSSFGSQLDVVAPGVKIPTTTNGSGYNSAFNGTSSACPHVAGLAALIINQNPCLTQDQVRDIIELTARKVGGYSYTTTSGRSNGTWDDEMGYGLIDAQAATQRALPYITGPDVAGCSGSYYTQTIPGATSYTWTWTGSSHISMYSFHTSAQLYTSASYGGGGLLCVRANNAFGACKERCRTLSLTGCGGGGWPPYYYLDGEGSEDLWFDVDDDQTTREAALEALGGDAVSIFPNPTSDVLNVQLGEKGAYLELVAVDGRIVMEEAVVEPSRQLDLSQLETGVYLLRVIQPNGLVHSEKVMKY